MTIFFYIWLYQGFNHEQQLFMVFANTPVLINPFHVSGLFLYPLKTSENLWFSDVFKDYRKRPDAWNGLIIKKFSKEKHFCIWWNFSNINRWLGLKINLLRRDISTSAKVSNLIVQCSRYTMIKKKYSRL